MMFRAIVGFCVLVLSAWNVLAQTTKQDLIQPRHAEDLPGADLQQTELLHYPGAFSRTGKAQNIPYPSFGPTHIIGMEIPFADPDLAHGNGSEVIEAGDLFGDGMNALMARYANIPDIRSNDPAAMAHKTLIFRGNNRTKQPDIVLYEYLLHIGDVNGDGRQNYISFDIDEVARIYSGSNEGLKYEATISMELSRLQLTQPAFNVDLTGNGYNDYLTVSGASLVVVEGASELSGFGRSIDIDIPGCQFDLAIADIIATESRRAILVHCRTEGQERVIRMLELSNGSVVSVSSKEMGTGLLPRLSQVLHDERVGHLIRWAVWPNGTDYFVFDLSSLTISDQPVWSDRDILARDRVLHPHYPYFSSPGTDAVFFSVVDGTLRAKRLVFGSSEYEIIASVALGDHRLITTESIPRTGDDGDIIVLYHSDVRTGHEFRSYVRIIEDVLSANGVEYDGSNSLIRWEWIQTFGDITGNGHDDLVARRSELNSQQLEVIEGGTLNRYLVGPEVVSVPDSRQMIREYTFGNFTSSDYSDLILLIQDNTQSDGYIQWFQGPFHNYSEPDQTIAYSLINPRLRPESFQLARSTYDVTGNGFADLVIPDYGTSTGLYVWEGGPGFSLERYAHYPLPAPGLNWISHYYDLGDHTGNGFSEIILSSWDGDRLLFYLGRPIDSIDFSSPNLILLRPDDVVTGDSHRFYGFSGIAVGDFDGNGKLNLIASPARSSNNLFHLGTDGAERLFIYEIPDDVTGQALEPKYRLKVPTDGVRRHGDQSTLQFTTMAIGADIFINVGDVTGAGTDSFIHVPSGPNWTNAYVYVAHSLVSEVPNSVLAAHYPHVSIGSPSTFMNTRYVAPVGDFTGSGNTEVAFVQGYSQHTRDNAIFIYTIVPEMVMVSSEDVEPELPATIALAQNYPNPFNPTTQITYTLPEASDVRLEVFTLMGQHVATLAGGQQPAGSHTVSFNASDLASGLYVYRLQVGETVLSRMMMVVK